jgi:histidinol-phosphate/aromatic aminotransferase/cobyric acid decarboxylase-like protein
MTPEQEALNAEIYEAWEKAGHPHTLTAFHDGYTAALAKAASEIAELRLRLEHVSAERTRLHNQCHDAAIAANA